MEFYRKTQYGIFLIGFCLLFVGFIYNFDGPSDQFIYSLLILSGVIITFGWLTITIDRTYLKIKMGIGPFGKKIPLKEIMNVKLARIPWWYGQGVRWYFGKSIYNVSGFQAVEITLKNKKVILLGTGEPNFLKQKLDSARSF